MGTGVDLDVVVSNRSRGRQSDQPLLTTPARKPRATCRREFREPRVKAHAGVLGRVADGQQADVGIEHLFVMGNQQQRNHRQAGIGRSRLNRDTAPGPAKPVDQEFLGRNVLGDIQHDRASGQPSPAKPKIDASGRRVYRAQEDCLAAVVTKMVPRPTAKPLCQALSTVCRRRRHASQTPQFGLTGSDGQMTGRCQVLAIADDPDGIPVAAHLDPVAQHLPRLLERRLEDLLPEPGQFVGQPGRQRGVLDMD